MALVGHNNPVVRCDPVVLGRREDQRNLEARCNSRVSQWLEISLEDALRGMTAEILIPRQVTCPRCGGSRAEPGSGLSTCSTCRGRGEVVYQQSFLSIRRTCPHCAGAGKIIRQPCAQCRGQGAVRVERRLKINVPPGVDTGTRLWLSHEGQGGYNGGPPGDLYVVVRVKEHPIFTRDGSELQ